MVCSVVCGAGVSLGARGKRDVGGLDLASIASIRAVSASIFSVMLASCAITAVSRSSQLRQICLLSKTCLVSGVSSHVNSTGLVQGSM